MYGLGMIGALVRFWQEADGIGEHVVGVVKSSVIRCRHFLAVRAAGPGRTGPQPTCTCGRRSVSGSASRRISRVTGATSPWPKNRKCSSWVNGLPSVHAK